MKLTTALLALIAAALFTTSAHATAPDGDLILGIYDTDLSVPTSYEANLGLISGLTNGETFSLSSTALAVFSSDSTPTLDFAIATTGGAAGGDGLLVKEIGVTIADGGTITPPSTNTTLNTNIQGVLTEFGAGSKTALTAGSNYTDLSVANGTTGSFEKSVTLNGGSYGLSSGANPNILSDFSVGTVVDLDEFTSGALATTELGTFTVTDTGITFNTVATPEPSTYALMVGGLLALWMMKRRRSNA